MVQRATLMLTPSQLHSCVGRDFGSVGDGFESLDWAQDSIKKNNKSKSEETKIYIGDKKPKRKNRKRVKKTTPRVNTVTRLKIGSNLPSK